MSATDDDIRADFLAEAGELIEQLGEQLMALEKAPQDVELLNAVFRAFHTVKGGAGFLMLTPLVEVCHAAEDVLNAVRGGKRAFDAMVMDAVLQALDAVQQCMRLLRQDQPLPAADAALVARLHALVKAAPPVVVATAAPAAAGSDSISDDEFEALLDQLQGKAPALVDAAPAVIAAPPPAVPSASAAAASGGAAPRVEVETVRVETEKLDRLMNLVGELVLVRNRLKSMRGEVGETAARAVGELDFIARGLQDAVMQARMQPIRKVFARFPKIARDIARSLGKQVEVVLEGEDTELDKNLVEALADPLVHMVRNSVDHGIEQPEQRLAVGKPAQGRLLLSAKQEGNQICIEIRDDGAGIDPERVRRKAIDKGIIERDAASQLSADDCLQMIFLPGFSTVEKVSDLSGRGVGMDVVQSRIKRLHGSVQLESKPGTGTRFVIRVPLTLAILPALIVRADSRRYALPLAPIADVFSLEPSRVQRFDRWDVVMVRDEPLRLIDLDRWLGLPDTGKSRHVVVARVGEERCGFIVREVLGREEIVIKPLGASLRGLAGVSGATVMPDGRIALILDFAGLIAAQRQPRGSEGAISHG